MGWRKQLDPLFVLSDGDWAKVHAARLAFSDVFNAGNTLNKKISRVYESGIQVEMQDF